MNKSYVSPDAILETNPDPRPISIPNAVAGYIADMIIEVAKHRVKNVGKKVSG